MIVKPTYVMEEIFGFLKTSPEVYFHSSFENSFNLKVNNIILNVSTNKTTLPPYGITLNEIDFISVKREVDRENVDIKISDNKVHINNFTIAIESENKTYNSDIILNRNIISKDTIEKLKDIITLLGKENGFNLDNKLLLNSIIYGKEKFDIEKKNDMEIFIEKLDDLRAFFKGKIKTYEKDKNENLTQKDRVSMEVLKYFVGRGRGLTPSGDDFLVGAMALFYSIGIHVDAIYNIKTFILENIGIYTNDISEQFLLLGAEGKFSRSIIILIEELKYEKICGNTINNVIKYGGTSGTDIMLGIIWANTILMEVIYE